MANDPIFTYLPAGWTEERYKNATDDDWETLSEEEAELLFKRENAEKEVASSNSDHQAFKANLMVKAQAAGAPPPDFPSEDEGAEPHFLVKLVEENGWDDFGFLVFRTYFGDEALWEEFRESWDPILQHEFDMAPASDGLERIRDKLLMKTVDDDMTDGVSAEGVASAYRLFVEDEDEVEEDEKLEPGLRTRMCLFVDQECMRSVTEPKASTPPFVKAVDVMLGTSTQQRLGATFKVAIKDLVTHFYPALFLSSMVDVAKLRPQGDGDVWTRLSLSVYGLIQQEEL
ncbi:hypothetical protein D6D13_04960 [Aureobasidium pullulans]|uniref:Uncharacterized protein n=1 Tax=Aureobasidium pullulans TaxID=5580 RepID=A0A4S9CWA0_AURPU|nr:hypothetical protein D6D13_04960 [Aureobasidium pullulans]